MQQKIKREHHLMFSLLLVEVNLVLVCSRKTNCFRIIHSSCKGKENWWFLHKKFFINATNQVYTKITEKSRENRTSNGTSDYPMKITNLSIIFFFPYLLSKKVCFCVFRKWTVPHIQIHIIIVKHRKVEYLPCGVSFLRNYTRNCSYELSLYTVP